MNQQERDKAIGENSHVNRLKDCLDEFIRQFGSVDFHADDLFLGRLEDTLEQYRGWIQIRKRKR